jgi:hypothetical protein
MTVAINPDDLYVEFKVRRESGRSWIIKPDEADQIRENAKVSMPIFKALVKAHMWRREIERGTYESVRDLARENKISESYARRIMTMLYLAPQIKEMILDGMLPKHVILRDLATHDMPILWTEQLVFLRRLGG